MIIWNQRNIFVYIFQTSSDSMNRIVYVISILLVLPRDIWKEVVDFIKKNIFKLQNFFNSTSHITSKVCDRNNPWKNFLTMKIWCSYQGNEFYTIILQFDLKYWFFGQTDYWNFFILKNFQFSLLSCENISNKSNEYFQLRVITFFN